VAAETAASTGKSGHPHPTGTGDHDAPESYIWWRSVPDGCRSAVTGPLGNHQWHRPRPDL